MAKKISIVIVSYNVSKLLDECLQSVARALQGIDGEVFVVDNHSVDKTIAMLKENHIAVVICSNNYKKRVKPFSDSVGLDCVSMSLKPFPFGFNRAKRKLKEKPQSVLVVGDQIYTDVLGANLAGMKSVLLVPRDEEHGVTIWIRRKLEVKIRKKIEIMGE